MSWRHPEKMTKGNRQQTIIKLARLILLRAPPAFRMPALRMSDEGGGMKAER
jgi:hypothetical protein